LSEKLLQLARADARVGQAEEPIDLMPFIDAVLEDFRRIGAGDRLVIECKIDRLIGQINGDAFGIIIRNLLENALSYSPDNSPIHVTISAKQMVIENDCAALGAEALSVLGKRFHRGVSQGQGTGLGLSIIGSLVQSMPMTIAYQSPIDGRKSGFSATLSFNF